MEKLFFEKRIYKELEKDVASWETQVDNIERAFDPYRPLFRREITREDVLSLCEKPVRKISKFDIKKAEEEIANIELNMDEVQNHLDHLVDYAINYFRQLKKKYGADHPRLTELKNFDTIVASTVAVANEKLYMDRQEGFIGTSLKKEEHVEYVCDCSDLDEVIVFHEDGKFIITKVADKKFVGKNILHAEVFKRGDDRHIYNVAYMNGTGGATMVKRFAIGGVSRDKEYDITKGKAGSKVLYFTSNPNGEAEVIRIKLKPKAKLKKREFDYDFSKLAVKSRSALGNLLTHYAVSSITMSQKGVSTLSAIDIYFESSMMRLNTEGRGTLLGAFKEDDRILAVYKSGNYRITGFELTNHFDDDLGAIRKWNKQLMITVIYYQRKEDRYFIKRFAPDTFNKKIEFVPEDGATNIIGISVDYLPQIRVIYREKRAEEDSKLVLSCAEFVEPMSFRARGKRINFPNIKKVAFIEPLPYEEPEVPELSDPEGPDEDPLSGDDIMAQETFKSIQADKPSNEAPDNEGGEQLSMFD